MDTTSNSSSLPIKPWPVQAIGRFSGGYCSATLQWPTFVRQVTAMVSWVSLGALVGHGSALHRRYSGMALTAMCSHRWMALLDLHLEGVASGGGTVHHIQSQVTEMAPQKQITWGCGGGEPFLFFFFPKQDTVYNNCLLPHLDNHIGVPLGMEWRKKTQAHARTVAVLCLQWFSSGLGTGMHANGLKGCSQP